ncbi:MAG: hypothetical protein HFE86_00820 [Clostridiales bacterium]|nr:hypothetical protein [Clostridiales bacterium]
MAGKIEKRPGCALCATGPFSISAKVPRLYRGKAKKLKQKKKLLMQNRKGFGHRITKNNQKFFDMGEIKESAHSKIPIPR